MNKRFSYLNKNNVIVIIIAVILIVMMFIVNIGQSKSINLKIEQDTTAESQKAVNQLEYIEKIYKPQITLPKGEYQISFVGGSEIMIVSADGTVLAEGDSNISLKTDRDITEMFVCSKQSDNLTEMTIKSGSAIFNDSYFLMLIFILLFMYLYLYRIRAKQGLTSKDNFAVLIILATAIFATYPQFTYYLYHGDDLAFHLYRVEGIKDGLLSGQFPVRIHPTHNNGYGYNTATMYGELFLYIPAILRIFGVSYICAWKIFLFIINIFTGLFMYYSVKGISKSRNTGIIAAVAYMLCTWRMMNVYVRGAIGEGLAMIFFPLIIWGMYEIILGDRNKWWILVFGCTGVFQSHMISTLLTAIFIIAMCLVFSLKIIKEKRYISLILAFVGIILINLWFIIPFLHNYLAEDFNIKYVSRQNQFLETLISPAQLFNVLFEQVTLGASVPNGVGGARSLTIGINVGVLTAAAVLSYVLGKHESDKNKSRFCGLILFIGLMFMFATTTIFPWEGLSKLKFVEGFENSLRLAWRMLSPASALLCMAGAYYFGVLIKREHRKQAGALFVVFCYVAFIFFGTAYTTGIRIETLNPAVSIEKSQMDGSDYEYMTKGTAVSELKANNYKTSDSNIKITDRKKEGSNIELKLSGSRENSWIEVPLLYNYGYTAKDNNKDLLETENGNNNVLRIKLNSVTESVKIKYSSPLICKIGTIISIFELLIIVLYIYRKNKYVSCWVDKFRPRRLNHSEE